MTFSALCVIMLNEVMKMFNYQPLDVLLAQNSMSKGQLKEELNLSSATVAKFSKNEYVSMEVLDKICKRFNCTLNDIVRHESEDGDNG